MKTINMEIQNKKLKSATATILKIVIEFLFIAWNLNVIAQDTINFRNGNKVVAVVKEISDESIKYKNYENLDGPDYVSDKNDIAFITYKNGMKEVFAEVKPWFQKKKEKENTPEDKPSSTEIKNNSSENKPSLVKDSYGKIENRGANRYKVNSNYLNYKETFQLMQLKENEQINMHIKKAKIAKAVKPIGFAAIPAAVIGSVFFMSSGFDTDATSKRYNETTGTACMVFGAACLTTSIVLGVKQKDHTKEAIRLYNESY